MSGDALSRLVAQALLLALVLSLPALGGALAAEALAWVIERSSGRRLSAALPVLRLFGVACGLALAAPWIGDRVLQFGRLALLSLGGGGGEQAGGP